MFEFLKNLLKSVNFKTNNKEINQYNKIIYSVIVLCAVCFIGAIVYFCIKHWPDFIEIVQENWNDSKAIFNPKQ